MGKVKLPLEVAEAIEGIRCLNSYYNTVLAISNHLMNFNYLRDCHPTEHKYIDMLEQYARYNPLEYVQALVNGYEVEQTPEEHVRSIYEYWRDYKGNDNCFSSDTIANVIHDVIDNSGMKIKGVNA